MLVSHALHDLWHSGVVLWPDTAHSFALCCISHSTAPHHVLDRIKHSSPTESNILSDFLKQEILWHEKHSRLRDTTPTHEQAEVVA